MLFCHCVIFCVIFTSNITDMYYFDVISVFVTRGLEPVLEIETGRKIQYTLLAQSVCTNSYTHY